MSVMNKCSDREKLDQFISLVLLYQEAHKIVLRHNSISGVSIFHTGAVAMRDAIGHYLVNSADGMKGVIENINMGIGCARRNYDHGDIERLLYVHGVPAEILAEKEIKTILYYEMLNNPIKL